MQKSILCFGDSNTWGFVPTNNYQNNIKKRYPRNIRWPGRLQQLLGDDFHIIEEGLNGRTTDLEYPFPPDRNGARYLSPCLYSHAPLDLVILALGGNDLKSYFSKTVENVCDSIAKLIDMIQLSDYGPNMQGAPKVLLLSQVIPLPIAETFKAENGEPLFIDLIQKAEKLLPLYKNLALQKQCDFLDVSNNVKPSSIDGVHMDDQAHLLCAEYVAKKIKTMRF